MNAPEQADDQTEGPSIFERLLRGTLPARFLMNSQRFQVAAVLDIHPAKGTKDFQVVIFPYSPGRSDDWDARTRMIVAVVVQLLTDRIRSACSPELVVKHEEGYGAGGPAHGHVVLFPSFERGMSVHLHDRDRFHHTVRPERIDEVVQALDLGDEAQQRALEQTLATELLKGAAEITALADNSATPRP